MTSSEFDGRPDHAHPGAHLRQPAEGQLRGERGAGISSTADVAAQDLWGVTVARFLADLIDAVEVSVDTDIPASDGAGQGHHRGPPQLGPDGRRRRFNLKTLGEGGVVVDQLLPPELGDLPAAAMRAVGRATSDGGLEYPSIARALHDVILAEVIADRLARRLPADADLDTVVMTVATTLEYLSELAGIQFEGSPVSHGVVIAGDQRGVEPVVSNLLYPGRLTTRKRTPLLFDGTLAALIVTPAGLVLRGVERNTLPSSDFGFADLQTYDELPGLDGALTAAASSAFHGIGFYLKADRSIWVFDNGALLFVRRGMRWKSIAFESFIRVLENLGRTSRDIAQRLGRSALRLSLQGQGAILAIASDRELLDTVTQPKDRAPTSDYAGSGDVDDDLRHLLRLQDISSPGGLARLARLDGATVIDPSGDVVAYGAIVRTAESRSEGARGAAARALSRVANVAVSISHDGPITVYQHGEAVHELL